MRARARLKDKICVCIVRFGMCVIMCVFACLPKVSVLSEPHLDQSRVRSGSKAPWDQHVIAACLGVTDMA